MCYYVKFKGLRNKTIVRERATKAEALSLFDYLDRHGIKASMGIIRQHDGSHGKPTRSNG